MNGGQITGLVFLGLGALTAVFCLLLWRQQRAYWRRALAVQAMVVGHQEQRHREQSSSGSDTGSGYHYYHARHPVFAFRTAVGHDVRAVHGAGTRNYPDYYSGQRVRISYDPQNPDNVSTGQGGEVAVFRTVALIGVGAGAIGVGIMVVASV